MNKTDCHNIAEILLKVALNTINPQSKHWFVCSSFMLNVSQSHRILNYFKLKSLVLLTFNTTWFYCVWHLLKTCYEYNWNTAYLMFNNNQLSYWFSLATPISSTNKTGHHCIVESCVKHHKFQTQLICWKLENEGKTTNSQILFPRLFFQNLDTWCWSVFLLAMYLLETKQILIQHALFLFG